MQKIILGIVGEIASGKSTVTEYLKTKHNAVTFRFSDMLRDVLKRLHVDNSRTNLQLLSTMLRQNFGEDLMSKVLAADVAESTQPLIITEGVRRPTDITYLKKLPGFALITLNADAKTRFERLTSRSENADDRSKTWEQFQTDAQQEPEQKIKEVAMSAQFVVDNNGTMEELFRQIDEIVSSLQS